MAYYTAEEITDRRINEDDGAIEYAVKWEGFAGEITWEKRHQLTENCAETVQAVDQRCMDATDEELERWRDGKWKRGAKRAHDSPPLVSTATERRKRSRSVSPAAVEDLEQVEVLNGLLLRPPRGDSRNDDACGAQHAEEEGTILMLGEVVLAEEASAILNGTGGYRKKRKTATVSTAVALHTAPALDIEKRWRDMHGQSLLHSIEVARSVTPFHPHFRLHGCDPATRCAMALEVERSSHLRIISIAPPLMTHSGAVFGLPVALGPLVGEKDVEQLRQSVQLESPLFGSAAQELVKPHVEQMVVRYIIPEVTPATVDDPATPTTELFPAHGRIASMPLSVFRVVFPQLLIDYLLTNSVVLR
ncbi:conserved hypothetical protein [Leishmania infantum JPCM5]|uniref:Uncharacterized protein n=2 Tax=Leishmania infantum TaxID=5671 RepID=A4HVV8_LEIIN|nr:conserved hypothetical protein [Leishmania infantum JPCM5]CAC9467841.1 hypothetical_protein_-_conserved [Leishmania infantum]CAM66576.2 conserved hypothetical protein [Leishmania infantum JPCM5]SUZ40240.1 hypothetical_protein_-_conserved [Leishmania infantum]|eukprot:XP_001464199.2 conserved hypothetical protein [Leishmania infantum JPCM5]